MPFTGKPPCSISHSYNLFPNILLPMNAAQLLFPHCALAFSLSSFAVEIDKNPLLLSLADEHYQVYIGKQCTHIQVIKPTFLFFKSCSHTFCWLSITCGRWYHVASTWFNFAVQVTTCYPRLNWPPVKYTFANMKLNIMHGSKASGLARKYVATRQSLTYAETK